MQCKNRKKYAILASVEENLTQAEIARKLLINKTTVSRALAKHESTNTVKHMGGNALPVKVKSDVAKLFRENVRKT